jgi:hypothetical protein
MLGEPVVFAAPSLAGRTLECPGRAPGIWKADLAKEAWSFDDLARYQEAKSRNAEQTPIEIAGEEKSKPSMLCKTTKKKKVTE